MPETAGAGAVTWLLLIYQTPAKSAALRAAIRRKLTVQGAVYVSQACAAVPFSAVAERVMRRLRTQITSAGGCAVLLHAQAVGGAAELTAAFNTVRDREYEDIIDGARDAEAALTVMTAAGDFGYQKLWGHDAQLKRLAARHAAITGLDILGADKAGNAAAALAGYRAALDDYVKRVYAADTGS